jgi:spore germination cell wall hydrolase CwlJ-like protein
MNVFWEARSQSTAGQVAVAQVVINRVNDSRYPDTICGVVTQAVRHSGSTLPVKHKCQFSWYCDGKKDKPTDDKSWSKALLVAVTVFDGKTVDILEGATHYHATSVYPDWANTKTRTARIDDHIFYRWEK